MSGVGGGICDVGICDVISLPNGTDVIGGYMRPLLYAILVH